MCKLEDLMRDAALSGYAALSAYKALSRIAALSISLTLVATLSGVAFAEPVTLMFELDEISKVSPVPVDGLAVSGASFSFEELGSPSMDAEYGVDGPGVLTYIAGKVLEGTTDGTLEIQFDPPSSYVEFGVALNTIGTVVDGFTVELFDNASQSLGVFSVDTETLVGFSEGIFLSGVQAADIHRAVVDFDDSFSQIGGNRRFLMDNLKFDHPEAAVPLTGAAGTILLIASFLAVALRTLPIIAARRG
jgi:hypothetical protein